MMSIYDFCKSFAKEVYRISGDRHFMVHVASKYGVCSVIASVIKDGKCVDFWNYYSPKTGNHGACTESPDDVNHWQEWMDDGEKPSGWISVQRCEKGFAFANRLLG